MRGNILIAPDHRVETPSVVKPAKEVKKTSNVVVEAEQTKVVKETIINTGTEYHRVIEAVRATINDPELAEHIVRECYSQAKNGKECVKHLVGVSNAESGMFKACGTNCFGVMVRQKNNTYKLKEYENKKYGITHWVQLYNKLGRYKRTTAQKRLEGNYCTSVCGSRIANYHYAVNKLGL